MCPCVVRPEDDIGHLQLLSALLFDTKFFTYSATLAGQQTVVILLSATNLGLSIQPPYMESSLLTASPQSCGDTFLKVKKCQQL